VGPPIACCMVKLVDVPEKNYYARDGKGEVSRKGGEGRVTSNKDVQLKVNFFSVENYYGGGRGWGDNCLHT